MFMIINAVFCLFRENDQQIGYGELDEKVSCNCLLLLKKKNVYSFFCKILKCFGAFNFGDIINILLKSFPLTKKRR